MGRKDYKALKQGKSETAAEEKGCRKYRVFAGNERNGFKLEVVAVLYGAGPIQA
jgi:hypothetical protein